MTNYNERKKAIGSRIREEREKLGLSKKELLPRIYKSESSHKTLAAWEDGTRLPDLDSIALMAELFDCDIGYLLGDYDEHRRVTADVCAETGLSESAVKRLQQLAKVSNGARPGAGAKGYIIETVEVLSHLIESDLFLEMTGDIALYLIFGGALPSKAYSKIEEELSKEEYERFYRWANGANLEIMARQDVKEMYLQKASDSLKKICEEMLKNG